MNVADEITYIKKLEPNKRLKEIRDKNHLSQSKVAELLNCNMTQQKLSEIEKGEQRIDIDTLIAYSDTFGVSADYILGISDVITKEKDIKTAVKYTGFSEYLVEKLISERKKAEDYKGIKRKKYTLFINCVNYILEWSFDNKDKIIQYELVRDGLIATYDNYINDLSHSDIDLFALATFLDSIDEADSLKEDLVNSLLKYFNCDKYTAVSRSITSVLFSKLKVKIGKVVRENRRLKSKLKEVSKDV